VIAAVITLQALQGLSDSETVHAVKYDLRWKAGCGLPVTAGAFHATTLTYWRRRLAGSEAPNWIFDTVKKVAETGVLSGRRGGRWTPRCSMTRSPPGHADPFDRRDPAMGHQSRRTSPGRSFVLHRHAERLGAGSDNESRHEPQD